MTDIEYLDNRSCGCMLGLAIGDALGAPVEFMNRAEILARFGPDGIQDLTPYHGLPAGTYTDDGQMSMATARGILDWRAGADWATSAGSESDMDALALAIWKRYVEWSHSPECPKGSPGATVLASLRAGVPLTLSHPVNKQGKGCGGVMRVAPLGLVGLGPKAFAAGARAATLTHRHPTSDTSAGFLAQLIDHLLAGESVDEAVALTRETLLQWDEHSSTLDAVDSAVRLAADFGDAYDAIGQIGHVGVEESSAHGKGWVAEEAMGIALFCALRHQDDFAAALRAAVNISGDSDSTGSITGAILGAALGAEAIPEAWREQVANGELLVDLGQELAELRRLMRAAHMKRHESRTKPRKCPACGSSRVASILWGMPAYSDKLQEDMDAGRIVLGGCCVTDDDPVWKCADCEAEIHRSGC
jgi:ADP-ribosyl-[dinitrogen reductase] hydrolase